MRKLFLSIMVAMGVLTITSCSQSETVNQTESQTKEVLNDSYTKLNNEIISLNAETFGNDTRSRLGRFFKRVWSVVVSDAVGGLFGGMAGGPVGAVAGATVCSATAAIYPSNNISLTRSSISNSSTETLSLNSREESLEGLIFSTDAELCRSDSLGYYHNLILLNAVENATVKSKDVYEIAKSIYKESAKTFNIPENQFVKELESSSSINKYLNDKLYTHNESESLSDYCQRLKNSYPELSNNIDVFENFMIGISSLDSVEESKYVEEVIDLISKSSIPEADKEKLHNAAIIGFASSRLWNVSQETK